HQTPGRCRKRGIELRREPRIKFPQGGVTVMGGNAGDLATAGLGYGLLHSAEVGVAREGKEQMPLGRSVGEDWSRRPRFSLVGVNCILGSGDGLVPAAIIKVDFLLFHI